MKALIQSGSSGRVPVPPEKRFLINKGYSPMISTTCDMTAVSVSEAEPATRSMFIRKTYAHLAGAVLLFVVLEFLLLNSPYAIPLAKTMLGGRWSWAIVLGLFIGVSHLEQWWANSQTSTQLQYLGLGLFVVAETIVFLPLLLIANVYSQGIILHAGVMTLLLFAGLTATVFMTRTDFSFLQPILAIGGLTALGVIIASIAFGFELGILFSAIMVLFATGAILYDTSKIMKHYNPTQHVAAALSLFASIALLFWYILRILMKLNRR
jgi:FtsH-binding integral membrane protein